MKQFEPSEEMLQNYIQNKLSPDESQQLELWLIDHPEVMQELELDLMLKQGITESKELESSNKSTKPNLLDILSSKRFLPVHFLAYGLMSILLFSMSSTKAPEFSSATFVELEKVRGVVDESTTIDIKIQENKALVLRFFPDSMTERYSLTMKSVTSNQEIHFNDLIADDYGSITVSLSNNQTIKGTWELTIDNKENFNEQNYLISIQK